MTRKLRRDAAFEVLIEIRGDAFIRPPHDAQRHWLLNRAMREVEHDLYALDEVASVEARRRQLLPLEGEILRPVADGGQ